MALRKNKVGPGSLAEDDFLAGNKSHAQQDDMVMLPMEEGKGVHSDTESIETPLLTSTNTPGSATPESESRGGRRFLRDSNSWVDIDGEVNHVKTRTVGEGALLAYFQRLASSNADDVDFETIDELLESGANISDTLESTGYSIMHIVASDWDETIAEVLLEKGANIHARDCHGRTPLHIAAITEHFEMIVWLVDHGAELEVKTFSELQTPLHYAARCDSIKALQVLVEKGGDYEVPDYKGRTPLHLATEYDRTVAVECLLSLTIPAEVRVRDNVGNLAIASMIRTMPKVASMALSQLHRVASGKRKQYFLLSHLEPEPGNFKRGVKTPFDIAVEEKRLDILAHPVMKALINEKWTFMKWLIYLDLFQYFTFLLCWSILIAYPFVQDKHEYIFPRDIWRIIVEFIALGTYVFQIIDELVNITSSHNRDKNYRKLQTKMLQDDLVNIAESQLAESERNFLKDEMAKLRRSIPTYYKEPWNIIDIVVYSLLLSLIILHIADVIHHNTTLASWVARVSCFVVILIWIRLFKIARAFRSLGPLVAIVNHLIGDIIRFFALYATFFIPYIISFWVLFGGKQSENLMPSEREDLTSFYRVAIMIFRMSLIDDYPYSSIRSIDEAMSAILVLTYLLFVAVVGLNLFIALLSDTFQRVYDNAQSVAILEQARLIKVYEDKFISCARQRYLTHIHTKCNPCDKFYDDDDDAHGGSLGEVEKITHQIYSIVSELQTNNGACEISEKLTSRIDQQEAEIKHITQQLEDIKMLLSSKKSTQEEQPCPSLPPIMPSPPILRTRSYRVSDQDLPPRAREVHPRRTKLAHEGIIDNVTQGAGLNSPSHNSPWMLLADLTAPGQQISLKQLSGSSPTHYQARFQNLRFPKGVENRGDIGIIQGHRRMKIINVKQTLDDKMWTKKLQPVKNN